jgi:hypothetical protein
MSNDEDIDDSKIPDQENDTEDLKSSDETDSLEDIGNRTFWHSILLVIIGIIALIALLGLILAVIGYSSGYINPRPQAIDLISKIENTDIVLSLDKLSATTIVYISGQVKDSNKPLSNNFTTEFSTFSITGFSTSSTRGNIDVNTNRSIRVINNGLYGMDSNNKFGQAYLQIKPVVSTIRFPTLPDSSGSSKPSGASPINIAPGHFADFDISRGSANLIFGGSTQMGIIPT